MNKDANIKVLGKTYRVKCPPELMQDLERCVTYLDEKMQQLQEKNKALITPEVLAITVALNLANEILTQGKEKNSFSELVRNRLQKLQVQIIDALA